MTINLVAVNDLNESINKKLQAKRSTGTYFRAIRLESWDEAENERLQWQATIDTLEKEFNKLLKKGE